MYETKNYVNIFNYYGYYTQLALYAEIERLANKRENYLDAFLAVITKEKTPDKAVISFSSDEEPFDEFVNRELLYIKSRIERIKAVKSGKEKPARCERCDYCRFTKKLTGTIHYSAFEI